MSRSVSPTSVRSYGLARVCRVWRVSRVTVHRHLAPSRPEPPRRPGPVGAMADALLLDAIRAVLAVFSRPRPAAVAAPPSRGSEYVR